MPTDLSIALPAPQGGLKPGDTGSALITQFAAKLPRRARSLGLIVAIVVLTICAGVGFQRLVQEQQNSNREKNVDTWLIAQVELEFLRLENAVDGYMNPLSSFDRDSMMERFDIFWSRLPVVLEESDQERLRALPNVVDTIQHLQKMLAQLEEPIASLKKGKNGNFESIRDTLKKMEVQLHQLVGDVMNSIRTEAEKQKTKLNKLYIELILYFVGILVSGTALVAMLLRQMGKAGRLLVKATRAESDALAARGQLMDAIESIPDGFILCDPDDQVILTNSKFREMHADVLTEDKDYRFEELCRRQAQNGFWRAAVLDREEWVKERLERHTNPDGPFECELASGTWVRIAERKTKEGRTVGVYTDITRLKQREEELRIYSGKLELSNQELQSFASVASHDLQEPLRKIEAFGDRLQKKYSDQLAGDGALYIDRMKNAAQRMRALINDLLAYSRVTSKANPYAPVSLANIAADVLSDLQVRIEETGGTVQVGAMPIVEADATQMRQLLQNLIANALKFRRLDAPSQVQVEARLFIARDASGQQSREMCEISVADNGIGFEEKYLERIFAIFQRLHGRNEYEGTGIGLATCRKIMERHGGTITARSTPGQGATFIATLPTRQLAAE